jgi:hypothetical protein
MTSLLKSVLPRIGLNLLQLSLPLNLLFSPYLHVEHPPRAGLNSAQVHLHTVSKPTLEVCGFAINNCVRAEATARACEIYAPRPRPRNSNPPSTNSGGGESSRRFLTFIVNISSPSAPSIIPEALHPL